MSRLWTAELRVGLAPTHTAVARTPRGLAPRTVYSRLDGKGLDAALDAQPKSRTDLCVVLSNHHVRYALLPPSDALSTQAEWAAYAAHVFEATHGRAARAWTIACSPSPRGHPRIASAVDAAFLESIRAQAAKHPHIRLVSVQPYLASAFERMRRALGRAPAWLAVVETGRAVIALVAGGRWIAIRARGLGTDWAQDLRTAIEREAALLAAPAAAQRIVVISDADEPYTAPSLETLRVSDLTLRPGMALDARRFALALA